MLRSKEQHSGAKFIVALEGVLRVKGSCASREASLAPHTCMPSSPIGQAKF